MINIEKFIRVRKKAKISQNELASGICTQTTLSNFESGKKIPSFKILNELCQKLGIALGDIVISSDDTKVRQNLNDAEEALLRYDYSQIFNLVSKLDQIEISNFEDLMHYNYLCGIYALNNNRDYVTASKYFNLIIENKRVSKNNIYYLLAMNGLGQVNIKLHEFEKAQKYYDQIIEAAGKIKMKNDVTAAQVLLILHQAGDFYSSRHDYKLANRILRYAYHSGSKSHQVFYMGRILYRLGQNSLIKDSKKQAKQYLHDARAFARFNHDQYVTTKAKQLLDELNIQQSI